MHQLFKIFLQKQLFNLGYQRVTSLTGIKPPNLHKLAYGSSLPNLRTVERVLSGLGAKFSEVFTDS